MDLGKFVRESAVLDWLDVFLAFREVTTVYEGKVYMIPLDGDVLSFFYRRDILEHFNLKVPRTWDEYAEVAEAVHGKTYNGTTLSGSCVGRVEGCVGSYWANLVHSSYTQSGGTKTGHMFNPRDMSPLAGAHTRCALFYVLQYPMRRESLWIVMKKGVDMGNGLRI